MTLRVMVVEDQPQLRVALRKLLEQRGIEVVGDVADGVQALELAQVVEYDVVLTDLKMPNLDGIGLTRELRRTDPNAAIVVYTAYADASLVQEGKAAGVSGWVLKGAHSDELIEALFSACRTT